MHELARARGRAPARACCPVMAAIRRRASLSVATVAW